MLALVLGFTVGLVAGQSGRRPAVGAAMCLAAIPALVPWFSAALSPADGLAMAAWLCVGLGAGLAATVPLLTRWAARARLGSTAVGALAAVEGAALVGLMHERFAPGDPGHPGLLVLIAGLSCALAASFTGTLRGAGAKAGLARLGGVAASLGGVALGWLAVPGGDEVAANAASVAAVGILPVALAAAPALLVGQPAPRLRRAAPALVLVGLFLAPFFSIGAVASVGVECSQHGPGAPDWCGDDGVPLVCGREVTLKADAHAVYPAEALSTYTLIHEWGMSPDGLNACYNAYPFDDSQRFTGRLHFNADGDVRALDMNAPSEITGDEAVLVVCLERVLGRADVPGVVCTGVSRIEFVTRK